MSLRYSQTEPFIKLHSFLPDADEKVVTIESRNIEKLFLPFSHEDVRGNFSFETLFASCEPSAKTINKSTKKIFSYLKTKTFIRKTKSP